jgi:hypothetical protein
VPAPNTSSGVRPPRVVHMNPTRVTVEVPSVVRTTSRSARSVLPAASRSIGSSQCEVPRTESTIVVQRISPTPASPKKKAVKKSKKRAREEEEETGANKKHRSNCKFFIFLPPLKALVDVFDVVSYIFYFLSPWLIIFLCSPLCYRRRSSICQRQRLRSWAVSLVEAR